MSGQKHEHERLRKMLRSDFRSHGVHVDIRPIWKWKCSGDNSYIQLLFLGHRLRNSKIEIKRH